MRKLSQKKTLSIFQGTQGTDKWNPLPILRETLFPGARMPQGTQGTPQSQGNAPVVVPTT
jgi:hypothetical protein